MAIVHGLFTFTVRQLIDGACAAVGIKEGGEAAVGLLTRHFTDHSQRLTNAFRTATDRAWSGLEVALAGESLLGRLASAEDRVFRQQVHAFLDAPGGVATRDAAFRQRCLRDLRAARKAGKLAVGQVDPQALARQAGEFARYADPQALLDAERKALQGVAQDLAGDYPDLARLLELEPQPGRSLLVIGVRYFFRRAVEEDPQLFQGLAFAKLERLDKAQEQGFACLDALLKQQGQRLEALLGELLSLVAETHTAVLDLQEEISGQSGQLRQIGEGVQKLLEQHHLQRREVHPGDSLSIRNDGERQLVKQLVARYRGLPEGQRRQVPALLNAVGKLEVVAGDFEAARQDFAAVATMVHDSAAQAEAHFNAYQVCLERRDWSAAMQEFIQAVKLDAKRFASFPVGKYQPQRILGAGGFGVAFLCKHKYMDAPVVVKTLALEVLGRDADKVFTEAQVLRQLDHPAIIRIADCGYVETAGKARPFLVMDYFAGMTLEEHVTKHGPLSVGDLLGMARPLAEGLQAAHGQGIMHRDVKPANVLIRKDGQGWQVKVIDFGLALRQKVAQQTMQASPARGSKTLLGDTIAGTVDYAAPEQLGRRHEQSGPYSDVYGWAKTCCYALFQTAHPLMKHWQGIPQPLADLLERCLDEDPKKRPASFTEVLDSMKTLISLEAHEGTRAFTFVESPGREPPKERRALSQPRRSRWPLLVGGAVGLLAVLLLLAMTVFRVRTKVGTVVVEVNQPGAEVSVDGNRMTITSPGDKEPVRLTVDEGSHQLKVVRGGFETVTKQFSLKAGATEIIKVRLEPLTVAEGPKKVGPESDKGSKSNPPPEQFLLIPVEKAATADTTQPLYDTPGEVLIFNPWGKQEYGGIPFNVPEPKDGKYNAIVLRAGWSGKYPKVASVPCGVACKAIHLLSGVAGGGWLPGNQGASGIAMVVRLHYADGSTEDHELLNGVHFANFRGTTDVPGSKLAFKLKAKSSPDAVKTNQVRYLAIVPKKPRLPIETIEFLKGEKGDLSSPIVMAVTVERLPSKD